MAPVEGRGKVKAMKEAKTVMMVTDEGSSEDEFQSATSSPWPEDVETTENPFATGFSDFSRPTPASVIDATNTELRRVNVDLHETRRNERDLDGPGWMIFAKDRRGLGIKVYQLYCEEGRVWRYKGIIMVMARRCLNFRIVIIELKLVSRSLRVLDGTGSARAESGKDASLGRNNGAILFQGIHQYHGCHYRFERYRMLSSR